MVSDDEILEAYRLLASHEGIFCEPASAAAFAGLVKMRQGGLDLSGQTVVCIATGGLAPSIAAETTVIDHVNPDLTLTGLKLIWERNQKAGSKQ